MRPELAIARARRRHQEGFALIAALALLVVLASTGAVMLRMTDLQRAGTSYAVLGLRAEWAARSGMEWGLAESIALGGCPAATTMLALSEGGLSNFGVIVRCSETTHVEGTTVRTSLSLRAEASFGTMGSQDFVYREVSAAVVL